MDDNEVISPGIESMDLPDKHYKALSDDDKDDDVQLPMIARKAMTSMNKKVAVKKTMVAMKKKVAVKK